MEKLFICHSTHQREKHIIHGKQPYRIISYLALIVHTFPGKQSLGIRQTNNIPNLNVRQLATLYVTLMSFVEQGGQLSAAEEEPVKV